MQEYLSDAIVLSCEPNGDLDLRVSLFTKRFGKLVAKAKSARKITSKLAGHLQPGNAVAARIVEKSGLRVADALRRARLDISFPDLARLERLVPEGEADLRLWHCILRERFDWKLLLAVLGWDPRHAQCGPCGARDPGVFSLRTQEFFCERCASGAAGSEVIYIGDRNS